MLQPADFAPDSAWFSGGIEWHIGATGHTTASRSPVHAGFEVADLRQGDEVIGRLWSTLTDAPLPERYDFRTRPAP